MKRIIFAVSFLTLFVGLTLTVSAQTTTPSASRTPKGLQVRQDVKVRNEERKEATKTAQIENRRLKITAFFERMMKRFEAAIERLEKLIVRIEARVEKEGMPTPANLTEAKTKLEAAKVKMQTFKDGLESLLLAEEPKAAFKKVGENVRGLKKDLVEIHKLLVHTIGDIKGLRVGSGTPKP